MSVKNFFYKVGKILSEGEGRQLLWLTALILFVLAVIILIFRPLESKDVLALFFGVDSLSETDKDEVLVRLFIYILGTLLFSTFLISIITNIFDNFSDSYKEGQLDVNYTRFTLFLGSNYMLVGMLRALSEKKDLKKPIVILTTRNIGELREVLFSAFSSKQYRKFRNNLDLIYGERNNLESLDSVNAGSAEEIYILGEDNEENHDGKSLAAVRLLKGVSRAGNPRVNCKVFLNDPYSAHSQIVKSKEERGGSGTGRFYLDLINIYDDIAERVLCEQMPVVGPGSGQHLHLVVSGYGQMSWSFVKTAFALLHFPNFEETTLKSRTTISVIDKKAGQFMKEFMSLYANINILSNIRYEYMENGVRKVRCSRPGEEYGDFLDVEWEFIEGDLRDPDIRERLETWAGDNSQVLAVAICDMDEAVNIGTALSLPRHLYETSRVFAFLPSGSGILDTFGSGVFRDKGSAIVPFGKESDTDILFEKRSEMAKRVHYVYRAFYPYEKTGEKKVFKIIQDIDAEWYRISEKYKLSNFYTATSFPVKVRSFGFNQDESVDLQMFAEARGLLDQVEHRRWVAAELLLGDYPLPIKLRSEKKKDHFYHYAITPWGKLSAADKNKDSSSGRMIPYIVSGNINLLIAGLEEYAVELDADCGLDAQNKARDIRTNISKLRE